MKKTLTVNLGGTVFNIDEDAYILLDNYINNLKYHFRHEDGAEEIVRDMEIRIAELFSEYITRGQQVITIENVEEVIARMGKPEEINSETDTDDADNTKQWEKSDASQSVKRRLYRNPDDKILGGVVSGLAAYFGWDTAWTRIAVLLCGIFLHGFILAYIIAWIIIPLAQTATEKLQMRGEPVNMENIGKTVTDGFERMNDYVHSDKPRTFLEKLGNAFFSVIGFIFKLLLIILAICLAPVVIVVLIVLFALLMAATGVLVSVPAFFYDALPYINWDMVGTSAGLAVTMVICGLLLIGIPIVGIIHLILHVAGKKEPMSTSAKVLLILLWVISAAVSILLVSHAPFIIEPSHLLFHRIL